VREFRVGPNDASQRLDRFLRKACPDLPESLLQKALRKRDVKRNGRPAPGDARLNEGDAVRIYLPKQLTVNNEQLTTTERASRAVSIAAEGGSTVVRCSLLTVNSPLSIVYEDAHILLLNKPAGLPVHEDDLGSADTLIARVLGYLTNSGAYDPSRENGFAPALCHRLDRNTSGLVLAAKTAPALRVLNEKMRSREIEKKYLCVVHGTPSPASGTLRNYLWKDEQRKQVYVRRDRSGGAKTAVTHYRVLETRGGLSLLECTLGTGRTHQIRAQLAHIGHPLLGDGKYGVRDGRRGQALCAYSLRFAFTSDAEPLNYLSGQAFSLPAQDFFDLY
jgi:23S rRNA pseudouridine955/2504/2580 synthase